MESMESFINKIMELTPDELNKFIIENGKEERYKIVMFYIKDENDSNK